MTTHLQPWHVAFTWAVGWVNRQQQLVIEYLCAENRVLREQTGKKRILLTDDNIESASRSFFTICSGVCRFVRFELILRSPR